MAKFTHSDLMEELLQNSPTLVRFKPGEIVEGTVITVSKNKILVNLEGVSTGVIAGREAHDSMNTIKELNPGDAVSAFVLEEEDEEGLVVLSLRKASQDKTWQRYLEAFEKDETIDVVATEANKGGLLLEQDGIKGFIPVSQLAPMNYPRVNGADSQKILARLQQHVGKKFTVKIINVDKDGGKLILSEKAAYEKERNKVLDKLKEGDTVKGKISGVVKFGIFVAFEGLEGLVHISEIAWGHVNDPKDYGKLGDEVEVMIIGIEDEKISLSMKRLTEDPWVEASKSFSPGTEVEGEVSRITPFGVFIKLNDEINGLIHVSELTKEEGVNPAQVVKMGEKIKAKVISVEPEEHRVGLSVLALTGESRAKAEPKEEATTETPETEVEAVEELKDEAKSEEVALTDIPGVGAKLAADLEKAGLNLEKLKKASLDDLKAVEGVGEKTAEKILEEVKKM